MPRDGREEGDEDERQQEYSRSSRKHRITSAMYMRGSPLYATGHYGKAGTLSKAPRRTRLK